MSKEKLLVFLVVFTLCIASLAVYSDAAAGKLNPRDPSHREEAKSNDGAKQNKQKAKPVKSVENVNHDATEDKIVKKSHEVEDKPHKNKVEEKHESKVRKHEDKEVDNNVEEKEDDKASKTAEEHKQTATEAKDEEKAAQTAQKHETDEETHNIHESEEDTSNKHENLEKAVKKKGAGINKAMKKEGFKLANDPSCADDVKQLCSNLPNSNNFAVLVCLQDSANKDDDQVSDSCHQVLWEYKRNLTSSVMFDKAAFEVCESSMSELKDCQKDFPPDGSLVNCLVEKRELVKNHKCQNFLTKMAAIVFSDYRLIKGFYQECHPDVKKFNCGKVGGSTSSDPHTQAEVIECLEDNIEKLSTGCQAQIKRVAELSSDDYHTDRAVFYACQDARERFCADVQSGQGKVYECLMKHKFEETMSEDCREKLTVRQKLGQEDVKANHALWEYCEKDFQTYDCKKGETEHGKTSHLILCLNQAIASGKEVDSTCQAEMQDVASQLFADYKLNPAVMAHCEKELNDHCKSEMKAEGGALDCLMGLGTELTKECYTAVHDVLKETNAGNDFKIDRPLYDKCQSFIASSCKGKAESMILSCLIDNIRADGMPPDCQKELYHLQFFLARDFSLDAALYRDCKDDAKNLCNAPDFSEDLLTIPPGIIIACLYRGSFKDVDPEHRVSAQCAAHVKNAMHARSKSVKLMPEIEEPCRADITKHCLDKHQESQELECLQTNYEQLAEECKTAVANITEMESEDVEMDQDLINACAPMVVKFCQEVVEGGNSEGVLPCLIENKHHGDMDMKCAASIEHWQILELKDVRFNHALKKACHDDIMKYCSKSSDKVAAVHCLSGKIHEMAMGKGSTMVSDECKEQVKKELVTEHEDIKLNPELEKSCLKDLKQYCKHVWSETTSEGQAKAETCLREKSHSLSINCYNHLFKAEMEEVEDPNLDYELTHVCKPMIKKYCLSEEPKHYMRCLRLHKDEIEMTPDCRKVVFERQKEGAEDFRLDPDIAEFCKADVDKLCTHIKPDHRGKVLTCLKKNLATSKLSEDCENFVRMRQEEAALDYRLDPALEEACMDEVYKLCNEIQPSHGNVVDCLKENVDKISSKACKEEVKRVAGAGVEDVHADPHLMDKCARDINKYCDHVSQKDGQVIKCLLDVYAAKNLHLKPDCKSLLTKRMQLWSATEVDVKFETISELLEGVHGSPNRHYIYTITLCFLAVIFFGGLCFGRVTKRVKQEYKDR